MVAKFSLLVAFMVLTSVTSFSQSTRGFFLSKVDNTLLNTVSVNLYTKNFTMVEDFQFSIDWDTTVLTYIGNSIPATALGLNSSFLNASRKGVGVLFFDATLMGITVPDSTIILTINLAFKNGYSKNVIAPVRFGNIPTAIAGVDTTDGAGSAPGAVPDTLVNGYISTPFIPTIANGSNGTLIAVTGATVPPVSYQWLSCSGPCGPGSVHSAIPGATSSQIVAASGVSYKVVAIYANGDRDSSTSVLPVKLLNFKGKNMNNTNILNWVTINETNAAEFEVERSVNGEMYTQVGIVKAAGNSTNEKAYGYTDNNVASFTNYYRLKMVDINGAYSYSSIIKLTMEGKAGFQVNPNPIENGIIKLYGSNMKLAKVYDINGKLLLNQTISNGFQAEISINNLVKGVYMINVTSTDGGSQTEKFIVK